MAVNLDVTPQVMMFAPSAGIERVFLCKAVSDCPSPSLSNIAALYSTVGAVKVYDGWADILYTGTKELHKLNILIKGLKDELMSRLLLLDLLM